MFCKRLAQGHFSSPTARGRHWSDASSLSLIFVDGCNKNAFASFSSVQSLSFFVSFVLLLFFFLIKNLPHLRFLFFFFKIATLFRISFSLFVVSAARSAKAKKNAFLNKKKFRVRLFLRKGFFFYFSHFIPFT